MHFSLERLYIYTKYKTKQIDSARIKIQQIFISSEFRKLTGEEFCTAHE